MEQTRSMEINILIPQIVLYLMDLLHLLFLDGLILAHILRMMAYCYLVVVVAEDQLELMDSR